ncbi:MAG TPA: hypothetical protein VFF27_00105 [Bacteroidia bacterium]|jgi:hypothetical protein|nr:hypothetical protein [Bacteroidia bacterium]
MIKAIGIIIACQSIIMIFIGVTIGALGHEEWFIRFSTGLILLGISALIFKK